MKSSIRKMLTAAGGPIKKIKTRDINGNWVYMDISTGRTTSAGPETGTIRTNAVNSVGGDVKTKQGRTKIALKQATSYNNRLYKVHNYANTTTRLKLKHQDVVLDKQGEPKIVLTDYTPASEAPMSGADPLLSFYVGGVGLKGIGALAKTGLWNIAKYAPTTLLGNYGRQYFVGDVFKNSFNGTTPMLTPQTISLLYLPTKQNESGLTSLKFFERKPSRISEAESLGFGKSRGFNPNFGDDIHLYYILKDRRLTILDAIRKLKAPEDMGVDETISKNSGAILDDGELVSSGYHNTPVSEKDFFTQSNMSFGRLGVSGNGHNYGLNLGGIATRVPDLNTDSKIVYSRPGANLDNSDVVVTAFDNRANKKGILLITKGMKDMESGAEFSGDASSTTAAEALYAWLRIAKNKPALRETAMTNAKKVLKSNEGIPLGTHSVSDPIHKIYTENATMSPDAYSYIYRTAANNPDKFHLGYQMNAGNFNSFARNPKNAYMYDVEQNYLNGLITPQEYVKLFNSWSAPLGGRRAYFYNGQIYKPQPFLIRNKQGGKMNILEYLKNGSGIHIKKKNRGKFTDYCGGKVTDACIRRAKASGNPTLVKRATFAANARKWKHKEGGLIQRLQLGDYFKKPIKWLAHLINNYGNTKLSSYPTGTSFTYAVSDKIKRHPELTYQQAAEKVKKLYNQTLKNIGLPTETTPSLSAAGLAVIGGTFSPWFAVPDIIFDAAASIDEPSVSNTLHTVADFPEAVAKITPTKVDDYVARGVLTIGNIDDAVSARGKDLFEIFNGGHGRINNTVDKTSVRESTRINSPKKIKFIKIKKSGGKAIDEYIRKWKY